MPRPGRPMLARLRVRGWLQVRTPLHVGGAERDPNGDLQVAVNGRGQPYVPGTSLAGALRAFAEGDRPPAERLDSPWGYVMPGTQKGTASRVVVQDALITNTPSLGKDGLPDDVLDPAQLETRVSVGVDRVSGTAAHGFLHGRLVVPRGAYLRLELDVESTPDDLGEDRVWLGRLLGALAEGRVRLGAAKTRGLGRVELLTEALQIHEQRFDNRAGLLAALHGDGGQAWTLTDLRPDQDQAVRQALGIEIGWRPAAPVMVRSAVDGVAVDAVPLTSATSPTQVAPVLPGSALKGRLRAQAERIERTVRALDAPTAGDEAGPAERSAAFRRQLDQLAAVRALFGAAPAPRARDTTSNPASEEDSRGVGAVAVDDCFATSSIPAEVWNAVYCVPGDDPQAAGEPQGLDPGAREELARYGLEQADHVAIDRWTGGAAEGRLYSVLEPHGLAWEPITLTVDLDRLARHRDVSADAALALLLLVLRDLKAGRVPLGYATNRGLGDITVDAVTLTFPDQRGQVELDEFLASPEADRLTGAWCAYIDGSTP
ncbi:hypothetical protein TH66_14625 [Carbonactinospora thermoautotrophica]|uniref:CRISPR type III-associated protein domain-containing protein n=3 Tax=Carbonactinospora thermoautotrophica TaxID=1469144 RepID=A0A132MQJ0_9ACTN|nr:RAMP superfamily CRISPR-associated protein [Carbonactinospora thermoautotrophica]KWX00145.1 hypothetical protein TH66_14625 [Carbonactinospora thermoautotrophica]